MVDQLQSAGTLLAVVALVYSTWDSDIREVGNYSTAGQYPNIEKRHERLRAVFAGKVLPLVLLVCSMPLILLPVVVSVIGRSLHHLGTAGAFAIDDFNSLQATLLVVWMAFVILAFHLAVTVKALFVKDREFRARKARWGAR